MLDPFIGRYPALGEDSFVVLKVDWKISSSCRFFYYYVILNVWVNFKLQEGKLNFGNLFNCFVNRFFSCRFVLNIEYSRQFSIVVWGIAFPLRRNNRMNFLEESAETRLVGAKWYWRMYQRIGSFSQWKAYLWNIASSKFHIISLKNCGLVILHSRCHCFHDSRDTLILHTNFGS